MRSFLASCSSPTRGVWAGGNPSGAANVIDYVTIASTGDAIDFGDLYQAGDSISGCASSTRGVFGGNNNAANVIQYITIATTGNSLDFGDLLTDKGLGCFSCSSNTRGLFAGGTSQNNIIEYVTIANTGNATDFGDLTVGRAWAGACSNVSGGTQ